MIIVQSSQIVPIIIHWQAVQEVSSQLGMLQDVQKVVVVDNSQQLTQSQLAEYHYGVVLVSNPYNRGFAHAGNQGAQEAESEWLLFLNPDVHITASQISQLLAYAHQHNLDALSPHSTDPRYSKPVPTLFSLLREFSLLRYLPIVTPAQVTLTGGCLLIKRTVFLELGGWDERFFLWFEDSDLTRRLLDAGYSIGHAPVAVSHVGGGSFAQMSTQLKKDIFFMSLGVYAHKHFSVISQLLLRWITARFSTKKLLPSLNEDLAVMVVPNVKPSILKTFVRDQADYFGDSTELVVVSSGIPLASVWEWRRQHGHVRFIPIARNYGFTDTVNIGLRVATGRYLGTCNDDVILEKNTISALISKMTPKVGSINPVITTSDGDVESVGIEVLSKGKAIPITTMPQDKVKAVPVDATNGACVIYSQQALAQVGIFDTTFGSYLEDIDLSLRLASKGYNNLVVPNISVVHHQHQTSNTVLPHKSWYDAKNWWLLVLKNWSLRDWFLHGPAILVERMRNIKGMYAGTSRS